MIRKMIINNFEKAQFFISCVIIDPNVAKLKYKS